MAQVALHRFNVIAGTDGGHGVGVAQIVEPGKRQSDGFHDPLIRWYVEAQVLMETQKYSMYDPSSHNKETIADMLLRLSKDWIVSLRCRYFL